jgi:opacity protein-like surface antigen
MKHLLCAFGVFALLSCVPAFGQDAETQAWLIMPSFTYVRSFPGREIQSTGWYGGGTMQYAGSGLMMTARCFHRDLPHVAFTFNGGVEWFSNAASSHNIVLPTMNSSPGIGEVLSASDFTAYPLTVGAQLVFPGMQSTSLLLFIGAEGGLYFIDGRLGMNQQTKGGFSLVGGFAIKIVEFGIRYTQFSDMRNLGASFGIRLNPFTL